MADDADNFIINEAAYEDMQEIVYSIKTYVDRRSMSSASKRDLDASRTISMKLEGIRFLLRTIRPSPVRDRVPAYDKQLIDQIVQEIEALYNDLAFRTELAGRPFQYLGPSRERQKRAEIVRKYEGLTAGDALLRMIEIAQASFDAESSVTVDPSQAARQLRRIVPTQDRVAPVQFEIRDGRLAIAHLHATPREDDVANARSARTMLIENGQKIIANLQQSNCDKRLLETVETLQRKLLLDEDIIQIGIINIGCEMMSSAFSQELPDAVVAMLKAQTTSVGLYVAQFEEWSRFSANAASIDLSIDDIAQISHTASRLDTSKNRLLTTGSTAMKVGTV